MPGRKCLFCGKTQLKHPHIRLHTFPRDAALRKKWVEASGLKDHGLPSRPVLCSKHFSSEAYNFDIAVKENLGFRTKGSRLKASAVPSIFNDHRGDGAATRTSPTKNRRVEDEYIITAAVMQGNRSPHVGNTEESEEMAVFQCGTEEIWVPVSFLDAATAETSSADTAAHGEQLPTEDTIQASHEEMPTADAEDQAELHACGVAGSNSGSIHLTSTPNASDCESGPEDDAHPADTAYVQYVECSRDCSLMDLSNNEADESCIKEQKYTVSHEALLSLFETCRSCLMPCSTEMKVSGTAVQIQATCTNNHVLLWFSQPQFHRKAVGSVLLAA